MSVNKKLNEKQVFEIHALCLNSELTDAEIGAIYGVSYSAVNEIKLGKGWKHLGLEPLGGILRSIARSQNRIRQRILDASKLDSVSGCWDWQLSIRKNGYGNIRILMRPKLAHRIAYEAFIGPIPEGLFVCHHCDNRSCCNPDHLFLGTHRDNMIDRNIKGRQARGSKSRQAKLTELDVSEILKMIHLGFKFTEIAQLFGVTKTAVRNIKIGLTWNHVTGLPSPRIQQEL